MASHPRWTTHCFGNLKGLSDIVVVDGIEGIMKRGGFSGHGA
jgi:hypothetical protein